MNLKNNLAYTSLSLCFIGLYAIGWCFPDTWWGVHFFAFLPSPFHYIWFALLIGSLSLGLLKSSLWKKIKLPKFNSLVIILLTLLMGVLFYCLPIARDIYGDAIVIDQSLSTIYDEVPEKYMDGLLGFNFEPSSGRRTLVPFYILLSSVFSVSLKNIFIWVGIIAGMGFCYLWLWFLKVSLKSKFWKYSLALIGLTAPFLLIYFGHMEFYPLVYLFQLSLIISLLFYIKNGEPVQLLLSILLLLVCIKLHPTALLYIPALFISTIFKSKRLERLHFLKTWKGTLGFLLTPIMIIGLILYFFVFDSYSYGRNVENSIDLDNIFLPLFGTEAPFDRYNLLSYNHFFDLLNVQLFSGLSILLVLFLLLLNYSKQISWNSAENLTLGFTLLLFLLFLFAINPLLSLPMDWDLFSIPSMILLVFIVLIIRESKPSKTIRQQASSISLASLMIFVPIITVHSNINSLSMRYESLGVHIFKTYYEWSETTLHTAVGMLYKNEMDDRYINRKQAITQKLEPYANPGNDTIYGLILMDNGMYYKQIEKDLQKARVEFNKALKYSPNSPSLSLNLMECNFILQDFEQAYKNSLQLIRLKHPNLEKALRISIHCAVEAGLREEAILRCHDYIDQFPANRFIEQIHTQLHDEVEMGLIKKLFKKAN